MPAHAYMCTHIHTHECDQLSHFAPGFALEVPCLVEPLRHGQAGTLVHHNTPL